MKKIGLTGGIGSGKSTVANIFSVLGIPVFDADSTAKKLMEEDKPLKTAIKLQFGEAAYLNDKLNKKYISSLVFNDTYQLELLNALVHPIAINAGLEWAAKQVAPYIIKEAALMFEAGSAFNLDFVIGVTAPLPLRIKRVMQRDHISKSEVEQRIDKQIEEAVKMKLCDFILINDEQQMLMPQVLNLHTKLLNL